MNRTERMFRSARDRHETSCSESREFHELFLCKRAAGLADIAEIKDFLGLRYFS